MSWRMGSDPIAAWHQKVTKLGRGNLLGSPIICVSQGVGSRMVHSPSNLEKPNRGTCHP
jgi:hypothetical protein